MLVPDFFSDIVISMNPFLIFLYKHVIMIVKFVKQSGVSVNLAYALVRAINFPLLQLLPPFPRAIFSLNKGKLFE